MGRVLQPGGWDEHAHLAEGEVLAYFAEVLSDAWALIPNRVVRSGNQDREIDIIAIGPSGVFAIDVKDWHGEIVATETLWYLNGDPRKAGHDAANTAAKILKGYIKQNLPNLANMWVSSMVVFAHETVRFTNGRPHTSVFLSPDEAANYMKFGAEPNMSGPTVVVVAPDDVERIASRLRGLDYEPRAVRFGTNYECDRLGGVWHEQWFRATDMRYPDVAQKLLRCVVPARITRAGRVGGRDLDLANRLEQRLRTLSTTIDPAVRPLSDWSVLDDGRAYFVVEFARGSNLRSLASEHTPSTKDAISVTLRVAEAIAALHAMNVGSGDICPDTVFLDGFHDPQSTRIGRADNDLPDPGAESLEISPLLRELDELVRQDLRGWALCASLLFEGTTEEPSRRVAHPVVQDLIDRCRSDDPASTAEVIVEELNALMQAPAQTPRETAGTIAIGIDLGHAETAAAVIERLLGNDPPEPLVLEGSRARVIPTAISYDERGAAVHIGTPAVRTAHNEGELRINFKSAVRDIETDATTSDFAALLWGRITERMPQTDAAEVLVRVGVPTSWTETQVATYRDVVAAQLPNVDCIRESRAALLALREERLGAVAARLARRALVIDLGSSTADITLFRSTREVPEFGDEGHAALGGSLIDEALLDIVLRQTSAPRPIEGVTKARALLRCRRAKEEFFDAPLRHDDDPLDDPVIVQYGDFSASYQLRARDVREAIETPLAALNGMSWKDGLADVYKRVASTVEEVDVVVLTGGAARMDFVVDLCRQVFGDAVHIERSTSPDLDVARGLALAARIDYKIARFDADVDAFLHSGAIELEARRLVPELARKVAEVVMPVAERQARATFSEWRAGVPEVRSLRQLADMVTRRTQEWFEGDEGRGQLAAAARDWAYQVGRALAPATDDLCDRYGLDRVHFRPPNVDEAPPTNVIDLTTVTEGLTALASIIASAIIATLFAGGGVALFQGALMTGPLGPAIVFSVAFPLTVTGLLLGRERATEKLMAYDVPDRVRHKVPASADDKLFSKDSRNMRRMAEHLYEDTLRELQSTHAVADECATTLQDQFHELAAQARSWLR